MVCLEHEPGLPSRVHALTPHKGGPRCPSHEEKDTPSVRNTRQLLKEGFLCLLTWTDVLDGTVGEKSK